VRYDLNGTLQKTPIAGPPPAAPAAAAAPARGGRGGGRVTNKVIENKKEEFGEMMKGLGQLVASYGHLPPEKMQAFAANATKGKGEGAMEGTAQIQGANVLVEGDSMTVWVDPASQMMRRVEIKTVYEGKPATLITDYKSVPNGPTYMAQAMLAYPEKNVELTVDNYEYAPSQP
jgi:enoyl reductase-like protein